jgi:hypothetical protein
MFYYGKWWNLVKNGKFNGATYSGAVNDIIGFAYDLDANIKLYFIKMVVTLILVILL